MATPAKVIHMEDHRSSSPQLEDGFVRIANELFDVVLAKLSSYRHTKVVLAIIRKTYGYGKKEDDISLSQIADMTGLHRPHVSVAIRELEAMRVINPVRHGKYGQTLGLNKHHHQWKVESEKVKAPTTVQRPATAGGVTETVTVTETVLTCYQNSNDAVTKTVQNAYQNSNHKRQPQKTTPKDNPNTPIPLRGLVESSPAWPDRFAEFWNAFGYKHGKRDAQEAWTKLGKDAAKEGADLQTLFASVLTAAQQEAARRPHLLAKGSTPKYAQGWLTDRRFEDESLQEWGRYSPDQRAVIDDYNAALTTTGWPVAVADPYVPERAAAISAFLAISPKPAFWKAYFGYVADNVPDAATTGIDWLIRADTYAKIREGVHRQKVTS